MRFAMMRHPETGGTGVVPESALHLHRAKGWIRVSDWADEPSELHARQHPDGPDLDAEPEPDPEPADKPQPQPEPPPAPAAKPTRARAVRASKEK